MWTPVFINNKTNRIILFTYRYLFDVPVSKWNPFKDKKYTNRLELNINNEIISFEEVPYWTLDSFLNILKEKLIPIFSSQKQKSLLKNFYNSSPELLNAIKRGEMIA